MNYRLLAAASAALILISCETTDRRDGRARIITRSAPAPAWTPAPVAPQSPAPRMQPPLAAAQPPPLPQPAARIQPATPRQPQQNSCPARKPGTILMPGQNRGLHVR